MKYLNLAELGKINPSHFQNNHPFPWLNIADLLTNEGLAILRKNIPDLALFEKESTYKDPRSLGSIRYELQYQTRYRRQIPKPWLELIKELKASEYKNFIKTLFGISRLKLRFQWQVALNGFFILPHCDSAKKIGSHIFYLNTDEDWNENWGGQTLILDDEKNYSSQNNYDFSDFRKIKSSQCLNNHSLIFARTEHSWHGVKPINCPEGKKRAVFTVIIEKDPPLRLKISNFIHSIRDYFFSKLQ